MSFGENLQFFRKKNNWSQGVLAEKLKVSRQSVSKWESDSAFPEMEKLLQICELFSCNLDTLLRGDAEQCQQEDTAQYDRAMNTFSKHVAAGVGLLIAGVGVLCLMSSFARMEPAANICFMLFAVIGVILLVIAGLDRERFIKHHLVITPFYTEEQLDTFQKKFTRWVACSIGALLLGLVCMLDSEELPLPRTCVDGNNFYSSFFLFIVAGAVSAMTYIGTQKAKYYLVTYNNENSLEGKAHNNKVGKWYGCIMLLAMAVFLATGFLADAWRVNWLAFAIGGILCKIVNIVLSKRNKRNIAKDRKQE